MSASYKKPTPPPRSASVKNRPQLSSVPIKRTQSADQNSEGYHSDRVGDAEANKSDSAILREIPPPEKPRDLKLHVVLPNVGSSRLSTTKMLSSPEDVNV